LGVLLKSKQVRERRIFTIFGRELSHVPTVSTTGGGRFCFHPVDGLSSRYWNPCFYLAKNCPLTGNYAFGIEPDPYEAYFLVQFDHIVDASVLDRGS
jgi:hypothetical protein